MKNKPINKFSYHEVKQEAGKIVLLHLMNGSFDAGIGHAVDFVLRVGCEYERDNVEKAMKEYGECPSCGRKTRKTRKTKI